MLLSPHFLDFSHHLDTLFTGLRRPVHALFMPFPASLSHPFQPLSYNCTPLPTRLLYFPHAVCAVYSWSSMLLQNTQLGYWNTLWVMLLDIYVVLTGPERRAVRIALWLAFFDQGCASTAIINYAPQVLERAGVTDYGEATLWSSAITAAKVGHTHRQGPLQVDCEC